MSTELVPWQQEVLNKFVEGDGKLGGSVPGTWGDLADMKSSWSGYTKKWMTSSEATWVLHDSDAWRVWDPKPHQCPHCLRDRHDGPLTVRVAAMFDSHRFDPQYTPESDDSPVLCVGSDAVGPPRPEPAQPIPSHDYYPQWIVAEDPTQKVYYSSIQQAWEHLKKLAEWPEVEFKSHLLDLAVYDEAYEIPETTNDLEKRVGLGFRGWGFGIKPAPEVIDTFKHLAQPIAEAAPTAPSFPVPESNADYDALAQEVNKKLKGKP